MRLSLLIILQIIFTLSLFSQNKDKRINQYDSLHQQNGKWIYYFNEEESKIHSIENYKNGIPIGKWMTYREDGSKYIKTRFKKKKAKEFRYFPNGKIESKGDSKLVLNDPYKISYFWDGKWKFYNEKGNLIKVSIYKKGDEVKIVREKSSEI